MPLGVVVPEHDHSGPLKGGAKLTPLELTTRYFRLATAPTAGWVLTCDAAGVGTWQVSSGGGVTDHGALTGLGDDDHAQYALLAGRDTSHSPVGTGQLLYGGTLSGSRLLLAGNSTTTPDRITILTRNTISDRVSTLEVLSLDGSKTPVTLYSQGSLTLSDPTAYSNGI